jgi:hypothetical protein
MATRYFGSVDDILGDRAERYFGDGYTDCVHSLQNLKTYPDGDAIAFSCAGVVQTPSTWSTKGHVRQLPHLSTIDMIELSLLCVNALLGGQSDDTGPRGWGLRALSIVADNAPVEGELTQLPIRGRIRRDRGQELDVQIAIAGMQIDLTGAIDQGGGLPETLSKGQAIAVQELMFDTEALVSAALVHPLSSETVERWSTTSCFAAALQLGQAILYELDGIRRSETNTLWMKRTSVRGAASSPCFDASQPIFVRLENVRKYTKGDGESRRADIVGFVANREVICSVTHRLPDPQNATI